MIGNPASYSCALWCWHRGARPMGFLTGSMSTTAQFQPFFFQRSRRRARTMRAQRDLAAYWLTGARSGKADRHRRQCHRRSWDPRATGGGPLRSLGRLSVRSALPRGRSPHLIDPPVVAVGRTYRVRSCGCARPNGSLLGRSPVRAPCSPRRLGRPILQWLGVDTVNFPANIMVCGCSLECLREWASRG